MTAEFMKGVIGNRRYWLPHCDSIRLRNCVQPPPRFELAQIVSARMRSDGTSGREPFDSSF